MPLEKTREENKRDLEDRGKGWAILDDCPREKGHPKRKDTTAVRTSRERGYYGSDKKVFVDERARKERKQSRE